VLSGASVALTLGALYVVGLFPAWVPSDAPPYALRNLGEVLEAVDGRGRVNLGQLKKRHAALETFVASLAAVSPDATPERFPTVEDRLAYWLNAYHALTLLELLDTRSSRASLLSQAFATKPIGGKWLSRWAIERTRLRFAGDVRLVLATASGAKGRGVLDGAPYSGDTLNPQLDDAMRRFMARPEHVHLDAAHKTVRLSELFQTHRQAFLAALPPERQNVLQVVWAYLPVTCAVPGCDTRADLDHLCGSHFDTCSLDFMPIDAALDVVP
jgi:Protein of unknown function, DUF547